jgi:DNA repair protein RadC
MLIKITKKMEEQINKIKEKESEYKAVGIIENPEMIYKYILSYEKTLPLTEKEKERFYVIGLNGRNMIEYIDIVSVGTLNASMVHPREVFRVAILAGVGSILLAHNHPSGEIEPSEADIEMTKRLVKAGEIIGIGIIDHIIVGKEKFYSFKRNNLL